MQEKRKGVYNFLTGVYGVRKGETSYIIVNGQCNLLYQVVKDVVPPPPPPPHTPTSPFSICMVRRMFMPIVNVFLFLLLQTEPGIYSPIEMLDFGILRTLDEPKTLRLNLINTGAKAAHITVSSCCWPVISRWCRFCEAVFCVCSFHCFFWQESCLGSFPLLTLLKLFFYAEFGGWTLSWLLTISEKLIPFWFKSWLK